MRATTLLLTAALTFSSTAVFAQSSYNIVVEPTGQTIDAIINAPIEYDDKGVVKAQHFNADSLTDEEYQAVLDEAARVRAYRDANGFNFEDQYVYSDTAPTASVEYVSSYQDTVYQDTSAALYEIDLYAPQTSAATTTSLKVHTVSKGDTLYNVSKRYGATVQSIQAENGLSGTTLSIGQNIRIPGVRVESLSAVSQPIFASAPVQDGYVTRRRVVEPVPSTQSPRIEAIGSTEAVYAILPKDTLFSISRRSCVGVADIISRNSISNPNNLQPGQRITLPVGHCLTR